MSDAITSHTNAQDTRKGRTPKLTSSVHDVTADKPPFGSRFLTEEADVFSQNAWDHVPPPDAHDEHIVASLARQRAAPCPDPEREKINDKPAKHWDNFYKTNADNFFRDRNWLSLEFPELIAATAPDAGPMTVCEIGCGAGNTAFPLLSTNHNPHLRLLAFDYAAHAVKLVQRHPLYTAPPQAGGGTIRAAVWDLTAPGLPEGVQPGSVDVALMVFVLSALSPGEWERAVRNLHTLLKPGGLLLLRDYGRYDLAQLRFRTGRLLGDNFYARGDKTRVYFFELDELALLFTGKPATSAQKATAQGVRVEDEEQEGAAADSGTASPGVAGAHTPVPAAPTDASASISDTTSPTLQTPPPLSTPDQATRTSTDADTDTLPAPDPDPASPSAFASAERAAASLHADGALFTAEQLGVDRRLLVNRKRQLKMYRVWMQGKFRKV